MKTLLVEPLTAENFSKFGEVIETCKRHAHFINQGQTERFHALARINIKNEHSLISIFRTKHLNFPIVIPMLERHALGSQAIYPINQKPFLVVVAEQGDNIDLSTVRAFITNGKQGVNYFAGTWHAPTIALESTTDMLVVDRGGADNCEEQILDTPFVINAIEIATENHA